MDIQTLRNFEADIRKSVPRFTIQWKDGSRSQRALGKVLFFNRQYMTGYVSTFYPKVYYPSKRVYEKNPASSLIVIAHERVHLLDTIRYGWWFKFSYLLPQILVIPGLIASIVCLCFGLKWTSLVFGLIGLAFLLPWPSPWRVRWEKRGYAMTMAVNYWLFGSISEKMKQEIRNSFLGWSYYKMSRNQEDISSWVADTVADIKSGAICSDLAYHDVRRFLLSEGLVRQ